MIIGEPTFQADFEWIEVDGCPRCGRNSMEIFINGPHDIILSCGHVVDVAPLINTRGRSKSG